MESESNLGDISTDSGQESTLQSEVEGEGFLLKGIPVGVSLVHGSIASDFLGNEGSFKEHPNAPAFFAFHSEFSVHAALGNVAVERCRSININSSVSGDVFLHNYTVSEPIQVIEFESFQELNDFIEKEIGFRYDENSSDMVLDVFDLFPDIEGFVVYKDAVRGEPEVVLNERGLAKISRQFKTRLGVEEQHARTLDDMSVPLQYRKGGVFKRMNKAKFDFVSTELRKPLKVGTEASRTISRTELIGYRVGDEMGRVHHARLDGVVDTFQESPKTSRGRLTRTRSANIEEILRRDSKEKTPKQGRRR